MDKISAAIKIDWKWVEAHLTAKERLGQISEGSTRKEVLKELGIALKAARSISDPKALFVKKAVTALNKGSIELEGGTKLSSAELSSYMKGAEYIYAYLVTIGKGIEDAASSEMSSGDHLLGYLLDRIGSFAAESMAKNAEDHLRRTLAADRLSVSMRFSPGYCDWAVEEQSKLDKIIDFSKIGVTLTESFMMVPKKSISAIVGVGPKKLFANIKSPCALCNMKVCDYRRND